jgi:hypothetical protein
MCWTIVTSVVFHGTTVLWLSAGEGSRSSRLDTRDSRSTSSALAGVHAATEASISKYFVLRRDGAWFVEPRSAGHAPQLSAASTTGSE